MSDSPHRLLEGAAFEYIERGVSIIPIHPATKRPLIKWKDFQNQHATEEDIAAWQQRCQELQIAPEDVSLAAITGRISGFVIVDCDNEAAIAYCKANHVWSPIRARTKHGIHLYFRHPGGDVEFRPRAGGNSRGVDWPKVGGLDFRGDGSYALVPPSRNYTWDVDPGFDPTDLDEYPLWKGWPMAASEPQGSMNFDDLDLTDVEVKAAIPVWEATRRYVLEHFPKTMLIPSDRGNGRNQRVLSYAAEQILYGFWGETLDDRVLDFMNNFFEEHLPEPEWKATCRSVETMERANHPERFTEDGRYIPPLAPLVDEEEQDDDDDVILASKVATKLASIKDEFFIRPIIPKGSIVQVVGYSGQGKSTLMQLLVHALSVDRKTFGPFDIESTGNILYLNYEEGRSTIKDRIEESVALLGDFPKNPTHETTIYAPSFAKGEEMYLNSHAGLVRLGKMIQRYRPEILIIDTVRSAFPGLDENDAPAWSHVNKICLRLRNLGVSVIMLQHRNKPSKEGFSSYAGSTNQITTVETQFYVSHVYEDQETAAKKGGRYDGDYSRPVYDQFYAMLAGGRVDWLIDYVCEIDFGKVRNPTDEHDDRYWIALVSNMHNDKQSLIALPSSKQRAIRMYHDNYSIPQICQAVFRKKKVVERWLHEHKIKNP